MIIFGFYQELKMEAVAVAIGITWQGGRRARRRGRGRRREAPGAAGAFRGEVYRCLSRRGDAPFELSAATLCAHGPVRTLAGLSLARSSCAAMAHYRTR